MPPRRKSTYRRKKRNVKRMPYSRSNRTTRTIGNRKRFTKRSRDVKSDMGVRNTFTSNTVRQGVRMRHGRTYRLSKSFRKKVLMASSLSQTFSGSGSGQLASLVGESQIAFYQINSVQDLNTIADQVSTLGVQQFTIEESSQEYTFTSACNTPIIGRIYELELRRDIPAGSTALSIFQQGLTQPIAGGIGALYLPNDIDVTLYDSSLFCSYFKIKKVKKFQLDPGSTMPVKMTSGNKYINTVVTDLTQQAADMHYTKFFAIQIWGTNVCSTVSGNVSTAPVALAFVSKTKYVYRYSQPTAQQVHHYNSLPLVDVPKLVNPETGITETAYTI